MYEMQAGVVLVHVINCRNGSLQTDASAPFGLEPYGSYHMGSSKARKLAKNCSKGK